MLWRCGSQCVEWGGARLLEIFVSPRIGEVMPFECKVYFIILYPLALPPVVSAPSHDSLEPGAGTCLCFDSQILYLLGI